MRKNGQYTDCVICGKSYYVIPSQEKRGRYKACSRKCGIVLRSQSESKKKGNHYPHTQRAETKICRACGNEFRAVNDAINRKQVYCSHGCYIKGNRISAFEDSVYSFLVEKNIPVERQIKKGRWYFDFAVPNTNILIEADGSYWHSKLNIQFRDRRKDDWCKLNNYELFRIDELQFYKNKITASQVIIDRMRKLDPEIVIKKNGELWEGL